MSFVNYHDVSLNAARPVSQVIADLIRAAERAEYKVVDIVDNKPWGGFVRFDCDNAEQFLEQFFPDLTLSQAKLGNDEAELSPKFLVVSPQQRLSWQRHARRAERWAFLTSGGYHKSADSDNPGPVINAETGDVVQFETGECHRLVSELDNSYVLVAEIWQHMNADNPSDEQDIERLADDYKR